ncbi:hypothetical protein MMC30_007817 [Trapelia coarctata]|nr:hypothetical protein [Trapelia coarctata]
MKSRTLLASPSKHRMKRIDPHLWEQYRTTIEELYVEQKRSLPEMRATMENDYGFFASDKQYKDKFKAWGWAKKISSSNNRFMLKKERHRLSTLNKKTEFCVRGSYVSPEKLQRSVARQPARDCKALSPLADTPPYISYRTPCMTPTAILPDSDVSEAERGPPVNDDQIITESAGPAATSETHDAYGQQPVDRRPSFTKDSNFGQSYVASASEQASQDLPTVHEEVNSEERDSIVFIKPMHTGGKHPYPEEHAAHSSRFKLSHANQRLAHQPTHEGYFLEGSSLGDSITQVSSSTSEHGSGVLYFGGNGPEDEAFSKLLQEAETLSDSFFQMASSFNNQECDNKCQVPDQGTLESAQIRITNSLEKAHPIYDRLLGGYEHLLRLNHRSRFHISPDLLALDLQLDPMAEDWQFVTQCCTAYGRVHRTHLESTLHLISIYHRCGQWVTLEALVTCLISDLELVLSVDGTEIIAAARLLLLLCSMRAGTECKKEWKWTDNELAETVFHRAIMFSKRLKYSCSFTLIQEALATLLYKLRKTDETQPFAPQTPGAQIYQNLDWAKIAHLLFMATICFEPGPESDTEEEWDYDDSSEDGQSAEEPTGEQHTTLPEDDWLRKKYRQVLSTKFGLCCLFIRWRKFQYVEDLLLELRPELEAELPRRPTFAIDAYTELASHFAQAHEWEDAKREYTRAKTAYERYRGSLEGSLESKSAVKEESEEQFDDCGVLEKLERVHETLDWGFAMPQSPSTPRSRTFQRFSLSPCETPTWVW